MAISKLASAISGITEVEKNVYVYSEGFIMDLNKFQVILFKDIDFRKLTWGKLISAIALATVFVVIMFYGKGIVDIYMVEVEDIFDPEGAALLGSILISSVKILAVIGASVKLMEFFLYYTALKNMAIVNKWE